MERDKKGFRSLPSVDRVISHERVRQLAQVYSQEAVVGLVRSRIEEARLSIDLGQPSPSFEELVESICARAHQLWQPSLRPIINATGVILHTNLGRAPLSEEAVATIKEAAGGYSNLEFDLPLGERSSRHVHVERLLCQLTGAEAALVVNNNASGVLLALTALAQGREVVVSRGQAVEIGGGFRIPEVLNQSGAVLVEVGTTNRTYLSDYEEAITESTAALLRVHTSNFRVIGFTHGVSLQEMVDLGRRRGLLVLDDLGSGCLLDTTQFGLASEPTPQESIACGVGLTFFSGDKLLGGPQAGVILGKRELVDGLKRHPLARAVRIDKLSLAGLEATLLHYIKGEAILKVPVWGMISIPLEELESRAKGWAESLGERVRIVEGESTVGGGSLPGETLSTTLLAIGGVEGVEKLAQRLREGNPPVVGRIERDTLLLDPRTVLPEEDEALLLALKKALLY